jgi:hypothetical protein
VNELKNIFVVVLLGLIISTCGVINAEAIIVDGALNPITEWDTWFIKGIDPNELTINDNYDIKAVYSWWDSSDVYIRTDLFGIPTLAKLDSGNYTPVVYQWGVDTLGKDGIAEFNVILELANQTGGQDRVALRKVSDGSLIGYGNAHIGNGGAGSIVEATFSQSLIATAGFSPVNDFDVGMFMRLDNAGEDPDDRLPDTTGYIYKTPEPGTMALLGMGIIGFAGSLLRKKFMA